MNAGKIGCSVTKNCKEGRPSVFCYLADKSNYQKSKSKFIRYGDCKKEIHPPFSPTLVSASPYDAWRDGDRGGFTDPL